VPRPAGLVTVTGDRALVGALLDADGPPVSVTHGDLARTLGIAAPPEQVPARETINQLPIDLVEVTLDGGAVHTACAHVVARSPWNRGHWLRGPILAAMNVEFIGDWDIAPRGHPNDGRIEVFEVDPRMSPRDRLAARRRLRSASHLPHPDITTRSIRSSSWAFPHALEVAVDGHLVGRSSTISITVVPDAAVVYA
jgi:hypothetical protein